jgi:RNA polymerase sigma factor (sigma-70 family)
MPDLGAFGSLVERHYTDVVAVAFAVTRDVAMAEDIAQETFITAWLSIDQLRDPSRVRPWLCGIARNRSKNALRRGNREVVAEGIEIESEGSALSELVDREACRAVGEALAALPANDREALVLYYWGEQSIADVAAGLAITEAAAQKRISRARKQLEQQILGRLDDTGRRRRGASAAAAAAIVAVLATRTSARAAPALGKPATVGAAWLAKAALIMVGAACVTGAAVRWRMPSSSPTSEGQSRILLATRSNGTSAAHPGTAPALPAEPLLSDSPDVRDCRHFHGTTWCEAHHAQYVDCAAGNARACFDLGTSLWRTADTGGAAYLSQGCGLGLQVSCEAHARDMAWFSYGAKRQDNATLAAEVASACSDGHAGACLAIAMHDPRSSAGQTAYERACRLGSHDACTALANMATTSDQRIAWLRLACEQNADPSACFVLGEDYAACAPQSGCEQHSGDDTNELFRWFGNWCTRPCPIDDAQLARSYRDRACELDDSMCGEPPD